MPSTGSPDMVGYPRRALYDSVTEAIKQSFRWEPPMNQVSPSLETASADLDLAFEAMRRISARVGEISESSWQPKPKEVKLSIGQIFRHRKHGYRGVIVAWYPSCPLDDQWVAQWGPFVDGTDQPFYQTMIDTKDRPQAMMTFAAQENLELLEDDVFDADHEGEDGDPSRLVGVDHPMMQKLFRAGPPDAGQHIVLANLIDSFTEDF